MLGAVLSPRQVPCSRPVGDECLGLCAVAPRSLGDGVCRWHLSGAPAVRLLPTPTLSNSRVGAARGSASLGNPCLLVLLVGGGGPAMPEAALEPLPAACARRRVKLRGNAAGSAGVSPLYLGQPSEPASRAARRPRAGRPRGLGALSVVLGETPGWRKHTYVLSGLKTK